MKQSSFLPVVMRLSVTPTQKKKNFPMLAPLCEQSDPCRKGKCSGRAISHFVQV